MFIIIIHSGGGRICQITGQTERITHQFLLWVSAENADLWICRYLISGYESLLFRHTWICVV